MKTSSSFFLGILGRVFFEEIGMTGTFGSPGLGLVRSLRRYFLENLHHWEFWRSSIALSKLFPSNAEVS